MTESKNMRQATFQANDELINGVKAIINTEGYGSVSEFFRFWTLELLPQLKLVYAKKAGNKIRSVNLTTQEKQELNELSENAGVSKSEILRMVGFFGLLHHAKPEFVNVIKVKQSEKEIALEAFESID